METTASHKSDTLSPNKLKSITYSETAETAPTNLASTTSPDTLQKSISTLSQFPNVSFGDLLEKAYPATSTTTRKRKQKTDSEVVEDSEDDSEEMTLELESQHPETTIPGIESIADGDSEELISESESEDSRESIVLDLQPFLENSEGPTLETQSSDSEVITPSPGPILEDNSEGLLSETESEDASVISDADANVEDLEELSPEPDECNIPEFTVLDPIPVSDFRVVKRCGWTAFTMNRPTSQLTILPFLSTEPHAMNESSESAAEEDGIGLGERTEGSEKENDAVHRLKVTKRNKTEQGAKTAATKRRHDKDDPESENFVANAAKKVRNFSAPPETPSVPRHAQNTSTLPNKQSAQKRTHDVNEPDAGNPPEGRKIAKAQASKKIPPIAESANNKEEEKILHAKATPYTAEEKQFLNDQFRQKEHSSKLSFSHIAETFKLKFGSNPLRTAKGISGLRKKIKNAGELDGPIPNYERQPGEKTRSREATKIGDNGKQSEDRHPRKEIMSREGGESENDSNSRDEAKSRIQGKSRDNGRSRADWRPEEVGVHPWKSV